MRKVVLISILIVLAILVIPNGGAANVGPTTPTGPTVNIGEPLHITCSNRFVRASLYNKLLRKQVEYGGPKVALRKKPVCLKTYDKRKVTVKRLKKRYLRRLETDVPFAIAVAFDPIGRTGEAMRVAWCESQYNRFITNGQYKGVFQLSGDHRARMAGVWTNAYDNAHHAALTVAHDGGWSQWECKP